MKYRDAVIAIFAKSPVAGRVKTRLVPVLGESGALRLHRALIEYTLDRVSGSGLAPFELWVSEKTEPAEFAARLSRSHVKFQAGADLGERMFNACRDILARARAVVIIGTDCPAVDEEYLDRALAMLAEGKELVLGPAEDGGYVLLGATGLRPEIFSGISWGSSKVLAETLERVEALKLDYSLLDTRWDVDRPEDLVRLDSLQPPLEFRFQKS